MSSDPQEMQGGKLSLLAKFGARYSLEPSKVYETLCKTAFASAQSQEQVVALLVVADQYGLNPFTKEIYAFPDKGGGVVPVVGVDGWNRIAQQHLEFDGVEFRYAKEMAQPKGAQPCPEWVEAIVYRKDRQHPVVVREYLDECFRPTGPWQSHTKRMLRHKALIQGYRTAFGFHGIYDPDEAEAIAEAEQARRPRNTSVADRVAARIGVDRETGEVIEGDAEDIGFTEDAPHTSEEPQEPQDDAAAPDGDTDPSDGTIPGIGAAEMKARRGA
jgi:phage recombination protein Bet